MDKVDANAVIARLAEQIREQAVKIALLEANIERLIKGGQDDG